MYLGFFFLRLWLISSLSYISAWLSFKMQYVCHSGECWGICSFGTVANEQQMLLSGV